MRAENFSKNLLKAMEHLGMTQARLAHDTGLTTAAVSLILSGKRYPSLVTIIAIMEVIPITFERLVSDE